MMNTKTGYANSPQESLQDVVIVGAGMAGSLLSCLLAQQGWRVSVLEKRADPRHAGVIANGRSINLALAERGLYALNQAGLSQRIKSLLTAMTGRCVHQPDGTQAFFAYSDRRDEVLWSVQRNALNRLLVEAAAQAGVEFHFNANVAQIDILKRQIRLENHQGTLDYHLLVGADGVDSVVRKSMTEYSGMPAKFEYQPHGYKELSVPAQVGEVQGLRSDALHIWPRGDFMSIALPNNDRSFTATLFLPTAKGMGANPSFHELQDLSVARAWFAREFPDLYPGLTKFDDEFSHHPVGLLSTLHLEQWQLADSVVLIGDAAHAMLPFHGQGMNCAFEDVLALVRQLTTQQQLGSALHAYQEERLPNAQAIQCMAIDNYTEMSSRVRTREFALERELSGWLERLCPNRFISRYRLVSFSRIPYQLAHQSGHLQAELIRSLTKGCQSLHEVDLAYARQQVEKLFPELDLTPYQMHRGQEL